LPPTQPARAVGLAGRSALVRRVAEDAGIADGALEQPVASQDYNRTPSEERGWRRWR